jgi:hypothetical protein
LRAALAVALAAALIAPAPAAAALAQRVKAAVKPLGGRVADLSAQRTVVAPEGPGLLNGWH